METDGQALHPHQQGWGADSRSPAMIIKVEFEEQVWADIINMLADQPYKRSGAIINTMAAQIQAQRPGESQMVASKPNGGERNVHPQG